MLLVQVDQFPPTVWVKVIFTDTERNPIRSAYATKDVVPGRNEVATVHTGMGGPLSPTEVGIMGSIAGQLDGLLNSDRALTDNEVSARIINGRVCVEVTPKSGPDDNSWRWRD
jgi:hypothetical protein